MKLWQGDTVSACKNFTLSLQMELDSSFLKEIKKYTDTCYYCWDSRKVDIQSKIKEDVVDKNGVLDDKEVFGIGSYLFLLSESDFDLTLGIDCGADELTGTNKIIFHTEDRRVKLILVDNEDRLPKKIEKALNATIVSGYFYRLQYYDGIKEVLFKINSLL